MSLTVAVIAAAGEGRRMGGVKKPFLLLRGYPLLWYSLTVIETFPAVAQSIVVVPADEVEYCKEEVVARYRFQKVYSVLPGGATRQESVLRALEVLPEACDFVVVQDGVRPFLTAELLAATLAEAERHGAATTAVPLKDTLKEENGEGFVLRTLPREKLWAVQTPQAFRASWLRFAHQKAKAENFSATDDAALLEHYGYPVKLVPGSYQNLKITTLEDLCWAEFYLEKRKNCE